MAELGGKRAPALAETLRRAFAMRDIWRPELADELVAIFDPSRLELRALGGGRLGQTPAVQDGASVANFSHAGIRNPAGSSLLCVLERINILQANDTLYRCWVRAVGAVDATQNGFPRDTRFGATSAEPILSAIVTQAAEAGTGPIWGFQSNVTRVEAHDFTWVLLPGFELFVVPSVNNTSVTAWFEYTAYPISQEEISLG